MSGSQAKCRELYMKEYLYMCTIIYIDTYIHMYVGQRERNRCKIKGKQGGRGNTRHLTIYFSTVFIFFFIWPNSPPVVQGLLIHEVSRSHSTPHHSRQDSSGRVISSSQRPLPDNAQHSHQTDIHAPGGIRIHNLNRRAAIDLRLRPRGH